jgi:exodeoxyribonuclease V alpha subunit
MQVQNNYETEVYNGDIGTILHTNVENGQLTVAFEGRNVAYDFSNMDELILSYAVSVHKAQGSEYPAVIVPLLAEHHMLLQRNLLYTAVTRAKKLAVIVGAKKALETAVKNDKTMRRFTSLGYRLADGP